MADTARTQTVTQQLLEKDNPAMCQEYEDFVKHHPNGNFMQSLRWTKVKTNWNYEALLVRNADGAIVGAMLILLKKVPILGRTFLYAPHGPVCDYTDRAVLSALMDGVRILAKKTRAYLFRMDPCILADDRQSIAQFQQMGFAFTENPPEFSTIQPRNNYVLDIGGKTEEELLASFHAKWRYNIRLAQRKGVQCLVCGKERLDDFYELMKVTGMRDDFPIRSKEYFARMLDGLGEEHCRLFLCVYQGKAISGAITTQYAGKTCYVYGASSNEFRNVMPNYLMQWTMICWALQNHCTLYDFMGIPCYDQPEHPNYGVYKFKKGFHGRVMTYAGEFDYCFRPRTTKAIHQAYAMYRDLIDLTSHLIVEERS